MVAERSGGSAGEIHGLQEAAVRTNFTEYPFFFIKNEVEY